MKPRDQKLYNKTKNKLNNKKKRNTKNTRKKRSYRKKKAKGGGIVPGIHYKLYSDIVHFTNKPLAVGLRPVYSVFVKEKLGKGGFASAYSVTVNDNSVKRFNHGFFGDVSNFFARKSGIPSENKTLESVNQDFSDKLNPTKTDKLFGDETFALRVFGKTTIDNTATSDERVSMRDIHHYLVGNCKEHVCELLDFGVILNSDGTKQGKSSNDTCDVDGCFYTLMEKGNDAKKYIYETMIKKESVIEILIELCEYCLQMIKNTKCLHDNNIYHFDLKPDNSIIMGEKIWKWENGKEKIGKVKLIDFGFSEKIDTDSYGQLREYKGTLPFMRYIHTNGIWKPIFRNSIFDDLYTTFVSFSKIFETVLLKKERIAKITSSKDITDMYSEIGVVNILHTVNLNNLNLTENDIKGIQKILQDIYIPRISIAVEEGENKNTDIGRVIGEFSHSMQDNPFLQGLHKQALDFSRKDQVYESIIEKFETLKTILLGKLTA
jgi:hypothetical protein